MDNMNELAMAAAVVTFEFDTWGAWRTSINGIVVAWHAGYERRPSISESLLRRFVEHPELLDEIASRLEEEIVE